MCYSGSRISLLFHNDLKDIARDKKSKLKSVNKPIVFIFSQHFVVVFDIKPNAIERKVYGKTHFPCSYKALHTMPLPKLSGLDKIPNPRISLNLIRKNYERL